MKNKRQQTGEGRLIEAGEAVIAAWEKGDLAAAVRGLAATITTVKADRPNRSKRPTRGLAPA